MSIRVIIADDHPIVRDGLRLTIESQARDIEIVGEAENGRQAVDLAGKLRPPVCILDITMPDLNGIDACREVLRVHPAARVIILSLHDSAALVKEALRAGARGYLLKASATRDVITAIREVAAGHAFFSPPVAKYVMDGFVDPFRAPRKMNQAKTLSARERMVLQLLAEGCSGKEIAAKLKITLNTVKVHKRNIMAKLELHKETDLVRYAVREGIAAP